MDMRLIGSAEACEWLGIDKRAFAVYLKRGKYPTPIANLKCGPIWEKSQFEGVVRMTRIKEIEKMFDDAGITIDGRAVWDGIETYVKSNGIEGHHVWEETLHGSKIKVTYSVEVEHGSDEDQTWTDIHLRGLDIAKL